MGSPERVRSSVKEENEEDIEVNIDTVRDDDDWVTDKRKQRSSKSRKPGSGEDVDGLDGSGKKRSMSDRHESRKRVGGSSRADSDQDDYETRKESRSKQLKKKSEENTLDVLSTWYQDGEAENKLDSGDKPGSRGYSRAEESERKKSTSKYSEHDTDVENVPDRDSRDLARRDGGREKGYGYAEPGRNNRRRWDEPDNFSTTVEHGEKSDVRSGKSLDPKLDSAGEREKSDVLEFDSNDIKSRGFEPMSDKDIKSADREERRVALERSNRGRSEFVEEDNKGSLTREDISSKERFEEHRQPRNPSREIVDGYAGSLNADEDVNTWERDKSRRDVENNTSRMPEKIGRRQFESDNFDMDYERSTNFRRKEPGRDGSWDDRSKGRDDNWGDRNRDRDRENVKDSWKRKQEKETRDSETTYDSMRDWELPRRGRDRLDGRSGGRKDGSRTEAVKTSSKYGISNENYDVIEIQTKSFDYGRDDSRTIVARNGEAIQQSDTKLAPDSEDFAYSREERSRNTQGSAQSGEDTKDRFMDGDQHLWRDDNDFQAEKSRGQKGIVSSRGTGGQSSSGGSLPPHGNQEPGPFSRSASQGAREIEWGD
ncbi:hypothetical protein DH2020_028347 [Rehmannia glutinosa]|uniref:Uncharacterized protein n=1 Tax=Rehmannia glutinosa TaxID=99300 RepID=A0ABR0VTE3_REHGL